MLPANLSDVEILTKVRAIAVGKGTIAWTTHALVRMSERGIAQDDVKACLANGHFEERPNIPNRSGNLEYEFKMKATIDSEPLAVVASLKTENRILVITAITEP